VATDYRLRPPVEGLISDDEIAILAEAAEGKLCLELGSYKGLSTIAMARTALMVVNIDHFVGSGPTAVDSGEDTVAVFRANLAKCGVSRKVVTIVMNLHDADWARRFLRRGYDLAFVDGGHTFEQAASDGKLAWDLTRPGGTVIFHDYNPGFPGVIAAVDQLAAKVGAAKCRLTGSRGDTSMMRLA